FSASAPSALQPAKLTFQLLVIQQLNLATAQNGDQVQVQVAFVQLRQLVSDAVLGELSAGPFTAVTVAEHAGHAVGLQEVAELLGHHRWLKRRLAGQYGIDHNPLTVVVHMSHRHRECIGPAAARVNETKIWSHMYRRQQLGAPRYDATLDSFKGKTCADVFSEQT